MIAFDDSGMDDADAREQAAERAAQALAVGGRGRRPPRNTPRRVRRAGLALAASLGAAWRFAQRHVVLCVSAAAALVTMAFVPPDAEYAGYFDMQTLICLFCILAVIGALRDAGAFERLARAILARVHRPRALVAALTGTTALVSMLATNDMALLMMLPLSAATLIRAGRARLIALTFVLQGLAANLGGMIVPFGNPQNLYLYSYFGIGLGDFVRTMLLPFAVSMILVLTCAFVLVRPNDEPAGIPTGSATPTGTAAPAGTAAAPTGSAAPAGTAAPARTAAYSALLLLVILTVFGLIPPLATLAITVAALAFLHPSALRHADWGLILTFVCFFVFAGNMARIPQVCTWLQGIMAGRELLVAALSSQIVSNVPAAVLLAHFTGAWQPLLVGVNIGGAGTLVGSLANLIVLRQFIMVRKLPMLAHAPMHELSTSHFMLVFSVLNFAMLAVLLYACR